MGEWVENSLEALLPVFEQLKGCELLSEDEVVGLVKRCRRYEYRLQKRAKSPQDYLLYVEYLRDVVTLICSRRARQDYWHKRDLIDKQLRSKMASLYRQCCDRFQGQLDLWKGLINFLKECNLRKELSKAYTRALQVHGRNVDLRVESALWEHFGNASTDNARALLQLAIRMSPAEYRYYAAFFRVEIHFVDKIMLRKKFLQMSVKRAGRGEEEESDHEDEPVLDVVVNDAVLQLRVAEIITNSGMKAVEEKKVGEMLLDMWSCLLECKNLNPEAFQRLRDSLEDKLQSLKNEDTQLFRIRQAVLDHQNEFDAYERAVADLPTEKMHRLFLAYCEKKLSEGENPLAEMKRAELLGKMLEVGWTTEKEVQKVADLVHDVCQGQYKTMLLQKALKSNSKSAVFWTEWLQHRLENESFETEEEIKSFHGELESAFKKLDLVDHFPIWELALDFAIANCPEKVEEIFDKAFKTASPPVASRVKIVRLGYLKALLAEEKITQSELHQQIWDMINQKPNEPSFYLAVSEQEQSVKDCDHSLIKFAYNSSINENGTHSTSSWLDFIRYSMKHDPKSVGQLYQRAMLKLEPALCPEFVAAWTAIQQEAATEALQKEKESLKRAAAAAVVVVDIDEDVEMSWASSYNAQVQKERGHLEDVGSLTDNIENMKTNDPPTEMVPSGERGGDMVPPPPQTSFGTSQLGFHGSNPSPFGRGDASSVSRGFSSQPFPSQGFQQQPFPSQPFSPPGKQFNNGFLPDQYQPTNPADFPNPYHAPSTRGGRGAHRGGGRGAGSSGAHLRENFTLPLVSRRSPTDEAGEKPMSLEEVALLNKFLHNTVKMMSNGEVDIRRQQSDPRSPLHSAMHFKQLRLKEPLLRALEVMGFHQPSKIQEFALPLLLMQPPTNMIAQSQSGTGKTAAFVLTMLSRVDPELKHPQAICLAPTYELAKQIGEVVSKMAQFMPEIQVHYAVKGQGRFPHGYQIPEQIIIGTPGRMIEYLTKLHCFDPSKIVCLVLDEADVMIGKQGHLDLSHRIYNTIESAAKHVQTMLFSATYDQTVMDFAEKLIKDAVSVTLKKEDLALNNIKQYFVECRDRNAKFEAVNDLYSGLIIASSVIFTRTRSSANWLTQRLSERGHVVVLLHGDMTVQERAYAIQQFKDGVFKVLITTNVCSRGIDVSQVTIVINYDVPYYQEQPLEPDYETYLHRIGRTGRFGKSGIAINFIDSAEDLQLIEKLEKHFGKPIKKLDPSKINELEDIEKD